MMFDLTGKKALVTGSSRGIGQQIALGLAQHGCNIILHGRKPENTAATQQLISSYTATGIYIQDLVAPTCIHYSN